MSRTFSPSGPIAKARALAATASNGNSVGNIGPVAAITATASKGIRVGNICPGVSSG
jgi:hypothetical protein